MASPALYLRKLLGTGSSFLFTKPPSARQRASCPRGEQVITLGIDRTERRRPRRRQTQFDLVIRMCEDIAMFMEANETQNSKAYISLGNGQPDLYLVTTKEAYDFDLGDKLAEFAASYIERGLLGSVTLLPASTPEQLAAYFNPKKAIRIEIEQVDHA